VAVSEVKARLPLRLQHRRPPLQVHREAVALLPLRRRLGQPMILMTATPIPAVVVIATIATLLTAVMTAILVANLPRRLLTATPLVHRLLALILPRLEVAPATARMEAAAVIRPPRLHLPLILIQEGGDTDARADDIAVATVTTGTPIAVESPTAVVVATPAAPPAVTVAPQVMMAMSRLLVLRPRRLPCRQRALQAAVPIPAVVVAARALEASAAAVVAIVTTVAAVTTGRDGTARPLLKGDKKAAVARRGKSRTPNRRLS
jgi:hypothetical protein